jgi:hypothetical protein
MKQGNVRVVVWRSWWSLLVSLTVVALVGVSWVVLHRRGAREMDESVSGKRVTLVCSEEGEAQPGVAHLLRRLSCLAKEIPCSSEFLLFRIYRPGANGEDLLKEMQIPWSSDMHSAEFEYLPETLGPQRARVVCAGRGLAALDFDVKCTSPRDETEIILLNEDAPGCLIDVPRKVCQEAAFSRYVAASGQAQRLYRAIISKDYASRIAIVSVLREALTAARCTDAEIREAMAR